MAAAIDHLVVSCQDLERGCADLEQVLGVALEPGGRHAAFGTHNRLLSLGPDAYLEVIAVDPDAPAPDRVRWFDLDRFSGAVRLTHWAVRVPDIAAAWPDGAVLELERGAYRWAMAVAEDGVLPFDDVHPALLEWRGPHPAAALPDRGVRLAEVVLQAPDPTRLAGLPGSGDPRVRATRGLPRVSARLTGPGGEVWL